MYYSAVLDSLITDLASETQRIQQELKDAPDGHLVRTIRESGTYYYQHLPKRGYRTAPKRIGITSNEDLIHQLARKKYVEAEQRIARENLQVLKKAREAYQVIDPAVTRDALGKTYQNLPLHMFTPWIPPHLRMSTDQEYYNSDRIHVSSDGTTVRSKSELVIMGRLDHFNVEAIYENEIAIRTKHLHPDFTIRRRRDGKIIYWEHAGIMIDPQYRKRHEERMALFEQAGIVPWENLIVTYDDASGGLDVRVVDALIQGWLL